MPPKKLSKQKVIQNQKIAARLIEISLQVDDCIYKKMSISLERAIKYKDEVALFEPKCQGDECSLQVIEKLKNFMKSIIEGHSTTDNENVSQSTCTALDMASYNPSLLDSSIKTTSRSIQVQTNELCDLPKSTLDKDNKERSADKNNITLTDFFATNEAGSDLERTLSNLSLSIIDPINKEIYSNFTKVPTLIESTNVKENEYLNNSETKLEVIDLTTSFSEHNLGSQDVRIHSNLSILECSNSNTVQKDTNKQKNSMIPPNDCMSIDLREQPSTSCSNIKVSDLESTKEVTAKVAFNIGTSDHIKKHTVQSMNTKAMKSKKNSGLKKAPINIKESKENERNSQVKPKRVRTKRKNKVINTESTIMTENITQNKNRGRRKNKKETNSGLSWIETLKFIRVIDPLEYDCSLEIPESFWHDDSLPSSCRNYF